MQRYAIAGIGTGVGKTLVSALLVERLGARSRPSRASYWKPVQAGGLVHTDTMEIRRLVTPSRARFLPEAYCLKAAMAPHAAAAQAGVNIRRERLQLPEIDGPLVVEPAGGILVPVAPDLLNIDLLEDWRLPVVVVSSYYLGSINHTLLTVEALRSHGIAMAGIVFNGKPNDYSRGVILDQTGLECLLDLPDLPQPVSSRHVKAYAARLAL